MTLLLSDAIMKKIKCDYVNVGSEFGAQAQQKWGLGPGSLEVMNL